MLWCWESWDVCERVRLADMHAVMPDMCELQTKEVLTKPPKYIWHTDLRLSHGRLRLRPMPTTTSPLQYDLADLQYVVPSCQGQHW